MRFQIYNPFVYYPDNLSLLNTSGEIWRKQRSVVASAFKSINTAHVRKSNRMGYLSCFRICMLNMLIDSFMF